jgi:quercetin 2,3-dioxygenase
MIQVRKSEERGHASHGWLDTHFTFSFDQYWDPQHVQFRSLRVINEDVVAPGKGFGMHPHRDMEILTWILRGALEHRDSMGSGAVLRPGELQHMSAGTGVMHSEFNPSPTDSTHLLQIWILPDRKGLKPEYEQLAFPDKDLRGKFAHLAGPGAPVTIHQDASLYVARLTKGETAKHTLAGGRHAWLQVARGEGTVNGIAVKHGDGVAVSNEKELNVEAAAAAEVLLFDLA